MPEAVRFAGSFIQAQLTGKGEAGSHAYDQVSDWKRWVCSRAVKYFSASEGDRPPSSCNTDCKASATAAGICLAFLEERAGDVIGKQENQGRIHIPSAPVRQQVPAAGPTAPSQAWPYGLTPSWAGGNLPHPATRAPWHRINDRLQEAAGTAP